MTSRTIIVDHVLFVVDDLDASRRLYTAASPRSASSSCTCREDGVSYGREDADDFVIGSRLAGHDRRARRVRRRRP